MPWYHSKSKRMLYLWLQLAGCVEDGGKMAGWIMGTEEGRSKVEAKLNVVCASLESR